MSSSSVIKQIILFVILIMFQVLVLNHIFFLEYATPFLYIYFIIKLPVTVNRNLVIFLGFVTGMIIDVFCNTMGINAAATTLIAFLRLPIQRLFFDEENFEHVSISLSGLGSGFIKYIICMIFVHHFTLISIEAFSYYNFVVILLRVIFSSVLTFLLISAIEGFLLKTKKE